MAQESTPQVYVTVVQAMEQRIADGEWPPGSRLPSITQLAKELGVSTGSVREAARVLATRGLLRIEHGRGIFVTHAPDMPFDLYQYFQRVDAGSILELFEARRVLEPELAALAAERGDEAEHQTIYDLAVQMERCVAADQDFLEPDIQFHQRIAAAAKNLVLAGMMSGLNDLILAGRTLTVRLPGMNARAVRYHLLIAEAIRDRHPLQARLLMLAHVNDTIDALVAMLPNIERAPGGAIPSSAVLLSQRSLSRP